MVGDGLPFEYEVVIFMECINACFGHQRNEIKMHNLIMLNAHVHSFLWDIM